MKAYNMNMISRHGLSPEDARGFLSGLIHGIARGIRKHFTAEDPYCLRRRLLRTVLKRIAIVTVLVLPAAAVTCRAGVPHQHANDSIASSMPASCRA